MAMAKTKDRFPKRATLHPRGSGTRRFAVLTIIVLLSVVRKRAWRHRRATREFRHVRNGNKLLPERGGAQVKILRAAVSDHGAINGLICDGKERWRTLYAADTHHHRRGASGHAGRNLIIDLDHAD